MPWALHHPPHLFFDETWYMITAATHQKSHFLHPEGYKDLVRDQLKTLVMEFNFQLAAWVVLDNHYHLLMKISEGTTLSRFFGRLHGRTAFDLNQHDHSRGRRVWHNYWDTCIRNETDYWARLNYIHHNPIKHGYVSQMEAWPFSSYHYYLEHRGLDWLQDVFRQYPVLDFTDPEDDF